MSYRLATHYNRNGSNVIHIIAVIISKTCVLNLSDSFFKDFKNAPNIVYEI